LADYIFYIGLTRTAIEFKVAPQSVINHICKEFTYSEDIGKALEERAEVDFDANFPDDIARDMEETEFNKIFEAQVKIFIEREAIYQSNKKKAFTLIYEQCHKTLQGQTVIKGNPIALLNAIQEHQMSYQENRYNATIVLDALHNLVTTRQKNEEDLTAYTRRFTTSRDVYESHIGSKMRLKKMADFDPSWDNTDQALQEACYEHASDLPFYTWKTQTEENMEHCSRG
jgi:hypothetical protein